MNMIHLTDFLLYSLIINYLILIIWFAVFVFAKDWMKQVHGQWFNLSSGQFDAVHYGGMAVYKIGILLLNLVPFIALKMLS
ncbi:DUF6868 family protein [Acinetobacter sp.]|jgi:hypothetical protein|uniref:DUF6868 family protein n=1 Tax=Acinetobacter sp. TaxID=472 RepID=UPI0035B47E8D